MREGFVRDTIESLIKSQGVALDIGANHGGYTWMLGEKFQTVYAFEPSDSNLQKLRENVEKAGNIVVVPMAISNVTGEGKLYIVDNDGGHSIAPKVVNKKAWGHDPDTWVKVDYTTIDDFMRDKGKRVDFIKCDIEGAEEFIFEGAIETLTNYHPDIIIEVHQTVGCEDLYNWFRALGYRWYAPGHMELASITNDEHYLISYRG